MKGSVLLDHAIEMAAKLRLWRLRNEPRIASLEPMPLVQCCAVDREGQWCILPYAHRGACHWPRTHD